METLIIELPHNERSPMLLINVYFNPSSKLAANLLISMLSFLENSEFSYIVTGDFNSPGFTSTDTNTSQRGSILGNFLRDSLRTMLVSFFEVTFIRGETRSCLDGTLSSTDISPALHCQQDELIGPGHLPFLTYLELPLSREGESLAEPPLLNPKFLSIPKFKSLLKEKFDATSPLNSPRQIKAFVRAISSSIETATTRPVKKERKVWWTKKCQRITRKRNRARKKLQKTPRTSPKFRKRKQTFLKLCKKAKEIFKREKDNLKKKILQQAGSSSSSKAWQMISGVIGNRYIRKCNKLDLFVK